MGRDQAVLTGGAREIAPATGKLGVMLVGLGAVSTTFIAGVENVRRGRALPIGSLSQMATIRLGKKSLIGSRRSEEHTSELQSPCNLVCRLLLEKKKKKPIPNTTHETDTQTKDNWIS